MSSLENLLNDAISEDDRRASIKDKLRQGGVNLDKSPGLALFTAAKEDWKALEAFRFNAIEIVEVRAVLRSAAGESKS